MATSPSTTKKAQEALTTLGAGPPAQRLRCDVGKWLDKFPEDLAEAYQDLIEDEETWPSAKKLYEAMKEQDIGLPGQPNLLRRHRSHRCPCYRQETR